MRAWFEAPDGRQIPLVLVAGPGRDGLSTVIGYGPAGRQLPSGSVLKFTRLPGRTAFYTSVRVDADGVARFVPMPAPDPEGDEASA